MPTTVQVSESTKRLLDSVRTDKRMTYDAIIRELVLEKRGVTDVFGAHKAVSPWTQESRARLRGE